MRKSEHDSLESLRRKFSFYAKKSLLTERSLDEIDEFLSDVGDSTKQLNKIQESLSEQGLTCVLDDILEQSKDSIAKLQSEIEKYKTERDRKVNRSSFKSSTMPTSLCKEKATSDSKATTQSTLDKQIDECRRRNKQTFLQEWVAREKFQQQSELLTDLKSAINNDRVINSDSDFAQMFKEWLELRASESFLKAESYLLDEELKKLERNNSLNLVEAKKSRSTELDIESLELQAIENQHKLQGLFQDVYGSNSEIESLRCESIELLRSDLLSQLAIPDGLSSLPDRIQRDLSALKGSFADDNLIDRVWDASRCPESERTNFSFRRQLKLALSLTDGLCEQEVLREVQQNIERCSQLECSLSYYHKSSPPTGIGDQVTGLTVKCEEVKSMAARNSNRLSDSSVRGENVSILSEIEQKLAELEEECGQYLAPWVKVEELTLRQYKQMIKDRYSGDFHQ